MNDPNFSEMDLQSMQEFEQLKHQLSMTPSPSNNFEVASLLLRNSDNTFDIEEIDKEIKLANLDDTSKNIITSLIFSYQDSVSLNDLQNQKYSSYLNSLPPELKEDHSSKYSAYLKSSYNANPIIKDNTNFLRKVLAISTISRGYGGFERMQQNTTIQQSGQIEDINSSTKKSILNRISGGI